jgi:tetratricopeptide (TPR) repeat protein
MTRYLRIAILILAALAAPLLHARESVSEQVQIGPPPMRRAEPPARGASADQLEQRGDDLRVEKAFVDALDYYRAALAKKPNDAQIYNKAGITELLLQRYIDARKDFEHSLHIDRGYSDAANNLGVIFYLEKKYNKAISQYEKAIKMRGDAAAFYSNLGAAYFSRKEFDKASAAYTQAVLLDPEVFEHSTHGGVAAQMSSPGDRAHYDFLLAKLFAKQDNADRALQYLRRAMEEGYKEIDAVLTDDEFASLRKDPRFTQLMASRPPAIPE